jgi:hypothetical protein
MKKLFILGTVSTLSLAACNASLGEKKETYSYKYTVGQCTTEQHSFKSKADLCSGLKDDAANKGCAHQERLERYKTDCDPNGF